MSYPCNETRHCVNHGFCHRCAPELAEACGHLVKAISAAGVSDEQSGDVYARLTKVLLNTRTQAGAA